MDSAFFNSEVYNERNAWEWLIAEASYDDCERPVNGCPVKLQRGQLTASIRFMAKKWAWDKNKVTRYLNRLEKWSMVSIDNETASGTGQSIITICKYDTYQNKRGNNGTAPEAKKGQKQGQGRDRYGTDAGQTINPSSQSSPSIPEWLPQKSWDEFINFRLSNEPLTELAKTKAIKKLDDLRQKGNDPVSVIDQSILNGWKGLFEDKSGKSKTDDWKQRNRMPSPAGG